MTRNIFFVSSNLCSEGFFTKIHLFPIDVTPHRSFSCRRFDFFIRSLTGVNADLRYYIEKGDGQNLFNLEAKTGSLTLARKLDYETR